MYFARTLLSTLLLSSTVSFAAGATEKPISFQCLGSNGLISADDRTQAEFDINGSEVTVGLNSSEGQLMAFEAGKIISDIENVTLKIPFNDCTVEQAAGQFGSIFRAMWCYRSEANQKTRAASRMSAPLKVLITKKDGSKISFENLNYKFTLTHARINDTASYSSQNSIELNISDKATLDKKMFESQSFVVFKGNNLRCF